jgi:hypothetical protein
MTPGTATTDGVRNSVSRWVKILPWVVPGSRLPEYFPVSPVFFLRSFYEDLPRAKSGSPPGSGAWSIMGHGSARLEALLIDPWRFCGYLWLDHLALREPRPTKQVDPPLLAPRF